MKTKPAIGAGVAVAGPMMMMIHRRIDSCWRSRVQRWWHTRKDDKHSSRYSERCCSAAAAAVVVVAAEVENVAAAWSPADSRHRQRVSRRSLEEAPKSRMEGKCLLFSERLTRRWIALALFDILTPPAPTQSGEKEK